MLIIEFNSTGLVATNCQPTMMSSTETMETKQGAKRQETRSLKIETQLTCFLLELRVIVISENPTLKKKNRRGIVNWHCCNYRKGIRLEAVFFFFFLKTKGSEMKIMRTTGKKLMLFRLHLGDHHPLFNLTLKPTTIKGLSSSSPLHAISVNAS